MNTQHAQGPWTVDGLVTKDLDVISPDGRIAMIDCDDCDADTLEANARLIAAAPDLLAALQAIVTGNVYGNPTQWNLAIDRGIAAIKKATGGAA